ncbi:hypothetical protein V6N13_002648 [Hibiscus sabdariffa]|uniref:Uncharacterized protein n=2 Tax=Hibiscus sabdariffa TaxID=183260 RepID=A0ABR2NZ97_9ROSI
MVCVPRVPSCTPEFHNFLCPTAALHSLGDTSALRTRHALPLQCGIVTHLSVLLPPQKLSWWGPQFSVLFLVGYVIFGNALFIGSIFLRLVSVSVLHRNFDLGGEMGEISSEMRSVSMENNVVNQNSDEFKRLGLGKQVLAVGQGDHVHGQQQQQLLHQGDDNNALLASQEIHENPTVFKVNGVVGDERVQKAKEKPKLRVTNDTKPRL